MKGKSALSLNRSLLVVVAGALWLFAADTVLAQNWVEINKSDSTCYICEGTWKYSIVRDPKRAPGEGTIVVTASYGPTGLEGGQTDSAWTFIRQSAMKEEFRTARDEKRLMMVLKDLSRGQSFWVVTHILKGDAAHPNVVSVRATPFSGSDKATVTFERVR